ncbi:hypothetical protein [Simonsiella muelleri]|uniref:Uncharacterized protein n=1 Tax=Simonsiella muelleri ATCC 29453 TaxID=641147 RepID=V9HL59_9NEIS|nr:hypothetical protein [Simonsiella muelleri]EFG30220.2 hypothetical protein HMPREF9021_01990 [Simonsiella muelleri ATCC 29453]
MSNIGYNDGYWGFSDAAVDEYYGWSWTDHMENIAHSIEQEFKKAVSGWLLEDAIEQLDSEELIEFKNDVSFQREWFFESLQWQKEFTQDELDYWFQNWQ